MKLTKYSVMAEDGTKDGTENGKSRKTQPCGTLSPEHSPRQSKTLTAAPYQRGSNAVVMPHDASTAAGT